MYKEYNVSLELSAKEKLSYIKATKIMREVLDTFKDTHKLLFTKDNKYLLDSDISVIYTCLKGRKINNEFVKARFWREAISNAKGWNETLDLNNSYYKMINDYWSSSAIRNNCDKFIIALRDRNFIYSGSDIKFNAIADIYSKLYDKSILIISDNKHIAGLITDSINKISNDKAITFYHNIYSQKLINFITDDYFKYRTGSNIHNPKLFGSKLQLSYILDMYKIGKYSVISTIGDMDNDLSSLNIDVILITSGNVKYSQYSNLITNKTTVINLYFDDFYISIDGTTSKGYKSKDKTNTLSRQIGKIVKEYYLEELLKIL